MAEGATRDASVALSDAEIGYPVEIFPDGKVDDKFRCNFCCKVLRDPVQSYCGHRFCKACIDKNIQSGQPIQCVKCKSENADEDDYSMLQPDQVFPDRAVFREMAKLKVVCSFPGCSWNGTFKQYEEHVKECLFRPAPCSQCGELVPVGAMVEHQEKQCTQRTVQCKHCKMGIKVTQTELVPVGTMVEHQEKQCVQRTVQCKHYKMGTKFTQTEEHNLMCPKFPMKCEFCGKKKIPREKMDHHLEKECTNQKIACPAGCGMFEKTNFQEHMMSNAPLHLTWTVSECVNLQKIMQALESQLAQQFGRIATSIDEKMIPLHTRIQALETRPTESVTELSGQPELDSRIRQTVEARVQGMTENIKTVEVKAGTFEGISNSLHRELDKTITALENLERHRRTMKDEIEELQQKCRSQERAIALKDIAIAELDLRVQSLESASYDGSFIWKVSEFSKRQQDASQGRSISIYSPAFYTSHHGYKACARLYPNGDGMGKGTHLSLFFVVMRGHFDALQQWPFKQRVTFCLVNQNGAEHILDSFRPDPASSSFKRPSSDMNIASGCPLFIRLENVTNPSHGFLRDDTLYIKVAVDVSDLRDPLSHPDDKIKVVPVETR